MGDREESSAVYSVPGDDDAGARAAPYSDARELSSALQVLRRVSLFSGLDDAELRRLAGLARQTSYRKGTPIVRAGAAGGSLMIVESGVIEVVLERQNGQGIRLNELVSGQYFGEMSVFDGQPRSATVIAITDCQILEIDRSTAHACLTSPPVIDKLLIDLSARLRQTDGTVRELSEQVYRAAYANVHAAVSVELDTIKLLYQRTEHRTAQVLEQAEQQSARMLEQSRKDAASTLARADEVAADVETRVKDALSLLKKRIVPIASIVATLLAAIGIGSFIDLKRKYDEARDMHAEMAGFQVRMREADRALRIVKETMTELRSAREVAGLGRAVETPADLKRVALDYEAAKAEIMQRYLSTRGDERRFERFEPEVVFEALDTYVSLALRDRPDGRLALPGRERGNLIDALVHVVSQLRDTNEATGSGRAGWLMDRKLRDLAYSVGESADRDDKRHLIDALEDIAARRDGRRSRENAALILASLGRSGVAQRDMLASMMAGQEPWSAAAASIALAKLGYAQAWKTLGKQLADTSAAYPYASLLAQEGKGALEALARRFHDARNWPERAQQIQRAIQAHEPRNCFEQRYDRWLLACLTGPCDRGPASSPIGGECTLELSHAQP